LGIPHILASEAELIDGQYTGKVSGTPCFQAGKISRLEDWLEGSVHSLTGSYFYSDSINDLPLLELVDNPVVVDGDEQLLQQASKKQWPCISLRDA
jgi:phosphoserine phosphatase